jgi:light-regulated signal transduction histidine kinase (bacteriophytochrome)
VNELEHFSYSITHDMRAPLRAMQGFAGLLAEECMAGLSEEHRLYLRRIMTATTRMDQLITDALSYSFVPGLWFLILRLWRPRL